MGWAREHGRGSIALGWGLLFKRFFLAMLGGGALVQGWQRWRDVSGELKAELSQADDLLWAGQLDEAERRLNVLLAKATSPETQAYVLQSLAYLHLQSGDEVRATQQVARFPAGYQPSSELRARLLATRDDVSGVIEALLPGRQNRRTRVYGRAASHFGAAQPGEIRRR